MASCVTHRGPWRLEAPPSDPGVELVLLANVSPADRRTRAVAARLDETLAEDRPRVVLWLGNVASSPRNSATPLATRRGPRCTDPAMAWESPAAAALAQSVHDHAEGRSFATMGVDDQRCRHRADLLDADPSLHPWRMPASHYLLRVFDDGSVSIPTRCSDGGCVLEDEAPTTAKPLVELVVVDLSPWLYPAEDPTERRDDDSQVAALEALLSLVAQTPPRAAPPRLLVSSVPVEAAGEHGMGALRPDATYHNLPVSLQQMLVEGHFVGVLAAHDRSLYASADISDAIKRADRAWLGTPVFQVAAGATSHPNARAGMALRRRRVRQSQAFVPDAWSDHPGFAVVHLGPENARVTLHARRGRRWETASLRVPLRPEPHPPATRSPVMAPCRDCPAIPTGLR